ncbi:uncharacterized protein LOC132561167 [Ylistrum balloti]|uniref:uncharacterized protein LOC132561167 n=1 Tax=Ylistrum balloti TaxID=509963 RepID=UPI002905A1BD|nr:uncharacterized protein LOC132561167 [Ylistrum balloti]
MCGLYTGGLTTGAISVLVDLFLTTVPVLDAAETNTTTVNKRHVPTILEIFVPCYTVLAAAILFLLLILFVSTRNVNSGNRRKSRVNAERWEMAVVTDVGLSIINHATRIAFDDVPVTNKKVARGFIGDFDKEVLYKLRSLHIQPGEIIRICLPAISTMVVGPLLMLGYYEIIEFFWSTDDYPVLPNINQCVACFLTPAGLVYAISFGFAFQQAINKQCDILEKMTTEISYLDQAATLTSKLKLRSPAVKVEMYRALKAEALYMILQVQKGDMTKYRHRPKEDIKVEIWHIIDHLQVLTSTPHHYVDVLMSQKIMEYVTALNSVCSDQLGILHSKIHWLKWAFLVTLGFFSLFGVLMIQAYSYRMELMMSMLTLFSIVMLCYIVADLDSPFTGFFRIDVRIISDVIYRLEMLSNMAFLGCTETACYPDSSKFRYKR